MFALFVEGCGGTAMVPRGTGRPQVAAVPAAETDRRIRRVGTAGLRMPTGQQA
jgi:hypothetical protein